MRASALPGCVPLRGFTPTYAQDLLASSGCNLDLIIADIRDELKSLRSMPSNSA
jgi:hypothetical protein